GNAALLFHMVQAEGAEITITGTPPRTRYARRYHRPSTWPAYAVWHYRHHNALAYVPERREPAPVRSWQANPVVKSVPQWPAWPW
ncbi:MAG TPA: hypothetical protein VMU78_07535, partial [Methylocella sp.]|nr:hypothetical protein [Methylocella sp.]